MFVQNVLVRGGSALAALLVIVACSTLDPRPGALTERPYQKRVYVGVSGAATRLQPLTSGSAFDLSSTDSSGAVATVGVDVGRRTAVEFTAADLGSASLAPIPTAGPAVVAEELAYSSVAGSVVYYGLGLRRQVAQRRGLAGYGRLGVNQTSTSADIALDAQDELQVFAGLGAEYMFSQSTAVRAEYIGYDGDAAAAQLGLVYRFGSPTSAPAEPIQGPLVDNRDDPQQEQAPSTLTAQTDDTKVTAPAVAAEAAPATIDSHVPQDVTVAKTELPVETPDTEPPEAIVTAQLEQPIAADPKPNGSNPSESNPDTQKLTVAEPSATDNTLSATPAPELTATTTAPDVSGSETKDEARTVTAAVIPPTSKQPIIDSPQLPEAPSPPTLPKNTQSSAAVLPQPTAIAQIDTAKESQRGFNGVVRGVDFFPGSSKLTPSATRVLQQLAKMLNQAPATRIEIRTHTDAAMAPAVAMQLTRQRAVAVARVLINEGVAKKRLAARAFGSNSARGDSATPAGRRLNNRVELKQL